MTPTTIEEWIHLARVLLSSERTRLVLAEAPPAPLPSDVGAVAGFGGAATDCDVRLSVYIFEEWAAGLARIEEMKARAKEHGRESLTIVNGCILFFATAGPADRDTFALFDLSARLSGTPRGSPSGPPT